MRKFLQLLAVSTAVLAATLPAQAAVITFDQGLDTSGVTFSPLIGSGDYMIQDGFVAGMYSTKGGAQPGDFVGALVDGNDVANTCFGLVCPTNNTSQFLAALDDGLPAFFREDGGAFRIKQFDASFIAADSAVVPSVAVLLRVYGFTLSGQFFQDFLLPGPDAAGGYSFSTYTFNNQFLSTDVVEVDFYAYACNAAGSCSRSGNLAQFGLDNVTFVPEPTSLALVGLAAAALVISRRRRPVLA